MSSLKIFLLCLCLSLAGALAASTTPTQSSHASSRPFLEAEDETRERVGTHLAVAFDFGGVLTREPDRKAVVRFLCDSLNLEAQQFELVNALKKQALQTGKTDEEFWLGYAKEQGISLPAAWNDAFKRVLKDSIGVDRGMMDLVYELKQRNIRVALLSNIDQRLARLLREFGMYDPFDPCLLSCEIGAQKPDAKAYGLLLEQLNLPARTVVFIDDRLENVAQAQAMGIDAILFESEEQIRRELRQRNLP